VLESPNFPVDIQMKVLEAFNEILKNLSTKKKIISNEIINALIKIGVSLVGDEHSE
jgi:hypothetical protein